MRANGERELSSTDSAVRPHHGHLMAKPPRLEPLDQTAEFDDGGAHFPLVVSKALRLVIGNGIVILAHVSEHAQQSLAFRRAAFAEAAVARRHEQRGKQPAV